ncbi:MAG: hypothetical protein ACK5RO_03985 [Pseudobdellovibrionaceae bacterium]|jgi:hypothetical protein
MKKILFISILCLLSACKIASSQSIAGKKSLENVEPSYGILPEEYRLRSGQRPLMWRCFELKNVNVKYKVWRDADPMGPFDKIVDMCDFKIEAKDSKFQHLYVGRRAKPIGYCNDFKAAWKKLTDYENHICLDGETLTNGLPEFTEQTKTSLVTWTWDKIATRKGCYAFWGGNECTDF